MKGLLEKAIFPPLLGTVKGKWAPVLLSPILGSPEQFVVAIAAANGHASHLEAANALGRLRQLYGDDAETALFATDVALAELKGALADRHDEALKEGALIFSGVHIGPVARGESASLKQLASTWMASMSSLYKPKEPREIEATEDIEERSSIDRLPVLVHDNVSQRQPELSPYFSEEIRNRRQRRSRLAGVSIDFSGARLVANFATLTSGEHAKSVDLIKRKIFDLIIMRDREAQTLLPRQHEMIVFSPGVDSGMTSDRQQALIKEAHEELGEQSEREEVGFIPLTAVPYIGERLVAAERQKIH